MISFRFHLVSLVAVFLALALGVLTGTTVLNRGIVAQLENQTDQLSRGREALRNQVRDLEEQMQEWTSFGDGVAAHLLPGRLRGTDVLLITQEGTAPGVIEDVREGFEAAGADLRAVLSVSAQIDPPGEEESSQLAESAGVAPGDDVTAEVARAIADRIALGPGEQDVLAGLLEDGFLMSQGPALGEDVLAELGGPDLLVIAVAGGEAEPELEPERFLVPLVEQLVGREMAVAAAEPLETRVPFVEALRGEAVVADRIVTQDNADSLPGRVGLVLGVQGLLEQGRAGHYGVKGGTSGVLPSP